MTEQYTQQHEANQAEEHLAEEISTQAKDLTDINKCETTHFTSDERQKREGKVILCCIVSTNSASICHTMNEAELPATMSIGTMSPDNRSITPA